MKRIPPYYLGAAFSLIARAGYWPWVSTKEALVLLRCASIIVSNQNVYCGLLMLAPYFIDNTISRKTRKIIKEIIRKYGNGEQVRVNHREIIKGAKGILDVSTRPWTTEQIQNCIIEMEKNSIPLRKKYNSDINIKLHLLLNDKKEPIDNSFESYIKFMLGEAIL